MNGGYAIEVARDEGGWLWRVAKKDRPGPVFTGDARSHTAEDAEEYARAELSVFAYHAAGTVTQRTRKNIESIPCVRIEETEEVAA